jgi:hypothetical protein
MDTIQYLVAKNIATYTLQLFHFYFWDINEKSTSPINPTSRLNMPHKIDKSGSCLYTSANLKALFYDKIVDFDVRVLKANTETMQRTQHYALQI